MTAPMRLRLDQATRAAVSERYEHARGAVERTNCQMVLLADEGRRATEIAWLVRRGPDQRLGASAALFDPTSQRLRGGGLIQPRYVVAEGPESAAPAARLLNEPGTPFGLSISSGRRELIQLMCRQCQATTSTARHRRGGVAVQP